MPKNSGRLEKVVGTYDMQSYNFYILEKEFGGEMLVYAERWDFSDNYIIRLEKNI